MKVFVMLADGFEEIEALTVVDVLRRGGVDTVIVSIKPDRVVVSDRKISVIADRTVDEIQVSKEDMIVLPGGLKGVQGLEASEAMVGLLKEHQGHEGWLAAICAAPSFPGKLGFYNGVRATCYPGFENELLGAQVSEEDVVIDRNFVTSRGPGTALPFSYALLSMIKGLEVAEKVKAGMLYK